MPKLPVVENKKLVLTNVICYELRNISYDLLDTKINQFIHKLKVLNVNSFGPLITKAFGTNINPTGELMINYDIMVQVHNYVNYKDMFKTYDRLVVENCVYVRFDDHPQYMNFAHNKLDLYFYEQDLISSDITYTVIVEENNNNLVMDLFKPVKTL